ncbi:uncharacterized protein LOC131664156 [Phymastichus coffea]|uniref:uncharacterized protein LOC131664156 n=1 Tax=Phymastichus coffea TaxID=108790 RepID=UPI00273B8B09|nr:uncharacterized protein LOC131664156 [Phymastichus coffea]
MVFPCDDEVEAANIRAQLDQLRADNERLVQQLAQQQQQQQQHQNGALSAGFTASGALTQANLIPAPAVHRVAVKLPPFWSDRPSLWFAQADSQFFISNINNEVTKFHYVISQLETRVAVEVEDIISNPPNETPYTYLRSKLIERLSAPEEQRVKRLISEEELGDRKPSQFLRYLHTLIGTTIIPDNLLRQFWLQRLPSYVQAIITTQITAQPALTLVNQFEIADKIIEVSPATSLSVRAASSSTSVEQESSHSALICATESLSKQVAELSTRDSCRNENRSNNRGRRQRSHSRQDSGSDSLRLCWYHHKFHDKAKKCISPCSWKSGNADGSS